MTMTMTQNCAETSYKNCSRLDHTLHWFRPIIKKTRMTHPATELAIALSTKAKHTEWPFYRAAEHGSSVAKEPCIRRYLP
jgi:hypothetical protein